MLNLVLQSVSEIKDRELETMVSEAKPNCSLQDINCGWYIWTHRCLLRYTVLHREKSHYFCSLPAECSVYSSKIDNTPNNGISLNSFDIFSQIQLRHCETPPPTRSKWLTCREALWLANSAGRSCVQSPCARVIESADFSNTFPSQVIVVTFYAWH